MAHHRLCFLAVLGASLVEYTVYTAVLFWTLFCVIKIQRKWTSRVATVGLINGFLALCALVLASLGWKISVLEDLLLLVSKLVFSLLAFPNSETDSPLLRYIGI